MSTDSPAPMRPLVAGELAPTFVCASDVNPVFDFGTLGGRWMVMLFFGSLATPAGKAAHDLIVARRSQFDDHDAMFWGVSVDAADKAERGLANSMPGLRYFWDFDAAISRGYRAAADGIYRPIAYLLDRTCRVVASAPASGLGGLLDLLQRHVEEDRLTRDQQFAPVLRVPRVFEPELCAELIAYYQARGGKPSGYMTEREGMTVAEYDEGRKRRRDVFVEEDEDLRTRVRERIERRLMPMMVRAFGWKATRMERYLVACYSAEERGFFFPHRDNTTAGTAHRKFAVTINLNADEYEGGDLRFPEYGPRLYKPPTGGAVVFGCKLLHEATAVTSGVRYAFLPFLYDEDGARLRAANLHKVAPREPSGTEAA